MNKPTEKPRQWKQCPLVDPKTQQRKGGISIGARDRDAAAKRTKLMKAGI